MKQSIRVILSQLLNLYEIDNVLDIFNEILSKNNKKIVIRTSKSKN